MKTDIIIVSPDFHIDSSMTGIGRRLWEMAVTLAKVYHLNVTIFLSGKTDLKCEKIRFEIYHKDRANLLVRSGNIFLVTYGCDSLILDILKENGKKLVFDALTTPLEILDYQKTLQLETVKARGRVFGEHMARYKKLLIASDYILVGSLEEKAFMIGELLMLGCITPANYREFSQKIDIVPVGFNSVSGKVGRRRKNGNMFVWNGGIWNHYRLDNLLAAFEKLHKRDPLVRLNFMYRSRTDNFKKVESFASREDPCVIMPDNKTNYFNRAEILSSAKGIVLMANDTLESYTSLRIRLKDMFVYDLPIIVSRFGLLGKFVQAHRVGLVVDNDIHSIEKAVRIFTGNPVVYEEFKKNIRRLRKDFFYRNTLKAFVHYIKRVNHNS